MKDHPYFTFAKLMDGILKAKKMKKSELAIIIGYDRRIFPRISNGYIPPKETVIAMGVALGLNIEQMDIFLCLAGYILCPKNNLDNSYIEVIEKFDGHGTKRIDLCNEELEKKGLENKFLLGSYSIKS